jgi:hypothetical protein
VRGRSLRHLKSSLCVTECADPKTELPGAWWFLLDFLVCVAAKRVVTERGDASGKSDHPETTLEGVVKPYLSAKTQPQGKNGRKHNSKYKREQYGRFPIEFPGNNLEVIQFFYSLSSEVFFVWLMTVSGLPMDLVCRK